MAAAAHHPPPPPAVGPAKGEEKGTGWIEQQIIKAAKDAKGETQITITVKTAPATNSSTQKNNKRKKPAAKEDLPTEVAELKALKKAVQEETRERDKAAKESQSRLDRVEKALKRAIVKAEKEKEKAKKARKA